ncbi:DUF6443 domain-containing protein [Chitinophaga solisilvae]|uniref:DUF6443 domain-containing protein n=1 Tax=Chitinophaga solisilvae TaxID=1233460 RepID=UPI00136DADAB|nr:DUF6443 domain-containing protein [Chitinophaga solisilvae]
MKYLLLTVSLILAITTASGQVTTISNFVAQSVITANGVTTQAAVNALVPEQRKRTVIYLDGLGRPLQHIRVQASPDAYDIITPVYFDNFGRNTTTFLPFADWNGGTGFLRPTAFHDQAFFYEPAYSTVPDVPDDSFPIIRQVPEASPLNRMSEQGYAGSSWQPGTGHTTKTVYAINTNADKVLRWLITADSGAVPQAAVYLPGELYKIVTTDPDGRQHIIFKDQEERQVLQRQVTDSAWLDTYYVYDDFSRLRYIIPPKATQAIINNDYTFNSLPFVKDELCYINEYDERGRVIRKKLPGTGLREITYDARDRVVFSRDGNLTARNNWLYQLYDYLSRPSGTALQTKNASRYAMQAQVNNYYVDTITGMLLQRLPDFTPTIALKGDIYTQYSPDPNLSKPFNSTDMGFLQYGYSMTPDPATTYSRHVSGLLTYGYSRVMDTTTLLYTTYYYDDKGRLIQTIADNINQGTDTKSTLYDVEGKILSTYHHYTNPKSTTTPDLRILSVYHYDRGGNLLRILKQLNNSGLPKTLVHLRRNHLGQMVCKTFGSSLDSMQYVYNIRGWLKSVNKAYVSTGNSYYFGFDLGYDSTTPVITGADYTHPQYNGNIAGTVWRSANDNIPRKYDFSYDEVNRLTAAAFSQQNTGGSAWTNDQVDYTVSGLRYDLNGNMLSMNQKGLSGTTSILIDSLKYDYILNSNKLFAVTDYVNNPLSILGDFKELNTAGAQDYTYDDNGNQLADMNSLTSILRYNWLNLPDSFYLWGKGYITSSYDARGNKLRKKVTDYTGTGRVTITDYIDGVEFVNDTLQSIPHEEGRIRSVVKAGQPVRYFYDYFEKDHLDNTRIVLTEQTDTTVYLASMETAQAAKEELLFSNVVSARSPKPAGYPADGAKVKNEFIALLPAKTTEKKTGPSLVLRVMAGDTVQISASAFYKSIAGKKQEAMTPLSGLLNSALQAPSRSAATDIHQVTAAGNAAAMGITPAAYESMKRKEQEMARPLYIKAGLNFALFDDRLKMIDEGSGTRQVKRIPDQLQVLGTDKMIISRTGYLYVYPDNESDQPVYFDNIAVQLLSGPLLEVTHYYPFGLTMEGISTNALKGTRYPENNRKFNSLVFQHGEFADSTGLHLYEAQLRMMDPQTGRWHQPVFQQGRELQSPYLLHGNNPVRYYGGSSQDASPGDIFKPEPLLWRKLDP